LARDEDPKTNQMGRSDSSRWEYAARSIYEGLLEFKLRLAARKTIVKENRATLRPFTELTPQQRQLPKATSAGGKARSSWKTTGRAQGKRSYSRRSHRELHRGRPSPILRES